MMDRVMPQPREFAHRLLSYESASSEGSESDLPAVILVCEKLRRQLSTLAGVEGFRSLLSRALALAKTESPALAAVQIKADGSLAGWESLEPSRVVSDTETYAELLLAHLLGLLITFIGYHLTLQIVKGIWPDATFDDMSSDTEKTP